jgi:hypothetical protein
MPVMKISRNCSRAMRLVRWPREAMVNAERRRWLPGAFQGPREIAYPRRLVRSLMTKKRASQRHLRRVAAASRSHRPSAGDPQSPPAPFSLRCSPELHRSAMDIRYPSHWDLGHR